MGWWVVGERLFSVQFASECQFPKVRRYVDSFEKKNKKKHRLICENINENKFELLIPKNVEKSYLAKQHLLLMA